MGLLEPWGDDLHPDLYLLPNSLDPTDPGLAEVLTELTARGVDTSRLLEILNGHAPPFINVCATYHLWRLVRTDVEHRNARLKKLRPFIQAIKRLDQQIKRNSRLSPLFSSSFKAAWEKEYEILKVALSVATTPSLSQMRLRGGFTVCMDVDLSRQGFWTPVVVALIKELLKAGISRRQAFRNVAHLLHRAFPDYPDQPDLVMRRYYHAKRSKRKRRSVSPPRS